MIINWDKNKVFKYLACIDLAIQRGKYYVAVKLANRLLKHYFRSFIYEKISAEQERDNLRLMTAVIARYLKHYFRKYKIPYSEQRLLVLQLMPTITMVYLMNTTDSAEDRAVIDEETATYVRKNVGNVVSFLGKYF